MKTELMMEGRKGVTTRATSLRRQGRVATNGQLALERCRAVSAEQPGRQAEVNGTGGQSWLSPSNSDSFLNPGIATR